MLKFGITMLGALAGITLIASSPASAYGAPDQLRYLDAQKPAQSTPLVMSTRHVSPRDAFARMKKTDRVH